MRTSIPIPWHVIMTLHLHIRMTHLTLSHPSSQASDSTPPSLSTQFGKIPPVGAQFMDVADPPQQTAWGTFEQIPAACQAKPWAGRESNAQPVVQQVPRGLQIE